MSTSWVGLVPPAQRIKCLAGGGPAAAAAAGNDVMPSVSNDVEMPDVADPANSRSRSPHRVHAHQHHHHEAPVADSTAPVTCLFPFLDLPQEMQSCVLSFLDHRTLCAMTRVSRWCHELANDNDVWRSVWRHTFGPHDPLPPAAMQDEDVDSMCISDGDGGPRSSSTAAISSASPAQAVSAVLGPDPLYPLLLRMPSAKRAFVERWTHRVLGIGSWALVRRRGEVLIVNRHMHRHGGVALHFRAARHSGTAAAAADSAPPHDTPFVIRAYHGTWTVSMRTGAAQRAAEPFPTCALDDWNALEPPSSEFEACGLRFQPVGRNTLHITPAAPAPAPGSTGASAAAAAAAAAADTFRVQRITLNGLSVGWLDVVVGGRLHTVYPSDRLDSGL